MGRQVSCNGCVALFFKRREESIAATRNRLYEARIIGVVAERVSDLANAEIEPVLKVDEDVYAPNFRHNVIAANEMAIARNQHCQNACRLGCKADNSTPAPQFACGPIQLKHIEAHEVHGKRSRRVLRYLRMLCH